MFENRKVAKSKLFKYSFTSFMLAGIFALCVFIYLTESAPIWKTSCCWGIDWCAIFFISCILHMKRKILPCLGGKRRCSDWDWRDESMRSDRFPARFVAIVLFGPGLYGLWHGFSELPEGTFPVLSSIWTAGATAFYSLLIFKGDEFSWCYRTSLAFAIAWGGGIVWRVVKYFMGN